tara:strand:- start:222 stop:467 length:246 start_codon:yes stop_codon:yes gene_type:complete
MLKQFFNKNITLVSIIFFIIMFILLIVIKPEIVFTKNGKPREFGLGYKNKTILPIWLFVIILAIFSYLAILFYIQFNRIIF